MEPAEHRPCSEQEYLRLENRSEVKHELLNGVVYDMAGASREHNLIASNLVRTLGNALEAAGRRCMVLGSDQRLYAAATGMYTYADLELLR